MSLRPRGTGEGSAIRGSFRLTRCLRSQSRCMTTRVGLMWDDPGCGTETRSRVAAWQQGEGNDRNSFMEAQGASLCRLALNDRYPESNHECNGTASTITNALRIELTMDYPRERSETNLPRPAFPGRSQPLQARWRPGKLSLVNTSSHEQPNNKQFQPTSTPPLSLRRSRG